MILTMRSHGWAGNSPAPDEEALERILDAADSIISERGSAMRIADVARTLGVRQTVDRYFPGTEALPVATAMRSADGFLGELATRAIGIADPVLAAAEGRSMLHRYDVDWKQQGFDEARLGELAKFCLRVLHSFLADPGRPPHSSQSCGVT
jgi:AcrR family transcriptional regulator